MAVSQAVRTVFGIIGTISSFCIFLSPLPVYKNIVKWKDTRGYTAYVPIVTAFNSSLWVLYGMPFVTPGSILVLITNGFGVGLEIIYVIVFLCYLKSPSMKRKYLALLALCVAIFVTIACCVLLLLHTLSKRNRVVGIVALSLNVCMYMSPLVIMRRVIIEKSVKYMPVKISISMMMNGIFWAVYGFLPLDLNLVISNGLGAIFGVSQIILYLTYYKTTVWGDDDRSSKNKMMVEFKNAAADLENNGDTA